METLFGYANTNIKSHEKDNILSTSSKFNTAPPAQIFILEPRKSQNIAIVLKSLIISRKEILDALFEGQGLGTDTLEKLTKMGRQAPGDRITSFYGTDWDLPLPDTSLSTYFPARLLLKKHTEKLFNP